MTSPLVASHLSKTYKGRAAVDDVSFAGRSGRVLGLLGKNGAGKTTTIKMLLDLVRPERGTAEINGRPYSTTVDAARHVGVALDDMSFLPGATVRFELGVWATTIGVPPVRVDEVIENVGLSEHVGSKVKSLSTGEKKRLSLGIALLAEPPLLILDEPSNGLDPVGIRWMRQLIRAHADKGGTVLLSSHILSEMQQTIDDVVIMQQRVLFDGTLDELTSQGASSLEDRFFELTGDE
ncbi:ATP-binding cassette domain-containing protein [Microbacterium laevaniformans]|uniref:ABC transporter ATP-binding protein n=1 Tax=Microbacterium laevaniformans TaxID=36807 RepID=UPI00195E6464|nr:ATP-binding cassette domain-containing protein [Microbacterium laevaniformans]MBM7752358.1 ABC-2 type transport system ATP-binding protein [Microbacterium laevaniformans]GLJ64896.1 ABC transporter [Microbacterium laevaniformans]